MIRKSSALFSRNIFTQYKMTKRLCILAIIVLSLASCVSRKKLTYLQDNGTALLQDSATFQGYLKSDYQLQVGDIIQIKVKSINEELNKMFNLNSAEQIPMGGQAGGADLIFYMMGYPINNFGEVKLPVIGDIKVTGLTIDEVKLVVEQNLEKYFDIETVIAQVQLIGINFKVVGDVAAPGRYVIYRNYATIFDALAEARDITFVGDRRQVEIIRMTQEGYKVITLDLTDRGVLNNPDYFIRPNDLINVKPLAAKSWGIGTTGFQSLASILGVISTLLTTIVVVRSFTN